MDCDPATAIAARACSLLYGCLSRITRDRGVVRCGCRKRCEFSQDNVPGPRTRSLGPAWAGSAESKFSRGSRDRCRTRGSRWIRIPFENLFPRTWGGACPRASLPRRMEVDLDAVFAYSAPNEIA